jgi:hypothetical protein
MITLKLLIWLLPIAFNVWTDRKGRKPDYLVTFIIRGIASILYLGWVWDAQGGYHLIEDVVNLTPLIMFMVTSWWLFFEVGLNLVRGKNLLYFDTVEKDSGWIDKFFAKYQKLHTPTKLFALLIMALSIYTIYVTN